MVTATNILITDPGHLNAVDLLKEIEWFSEAAETSIKLYLQQESVYKSVFEIESPDYTESESVFAEFIRFYQLSFNERIVLMLALLPHIAPQMLDIFFTRNQNTERGHTAFGGLKGTAHSGFLPTGETALFILAGNDLGKRFKIQQLFDVDHIFSRHNILRLGASPANEPVFSGQLIINEEYVDFFTGGKLRKPLFSMDFPAKHITTDLEWDDLVLDTHTMRQLNEIKIWLEYGPKLMNEWEMKKRLKPGYKALFHGAPGTGKTLTAGLLGKLANLEVYRVDLSMVVSKYIGETEKNLEKIFAKAEHKNWILFFDEADALFGKRTDVRDSHDRYANLEVSYLLQRMETYSGLAILATNLKRNIDTAFLRRIRFVINCPFPDAVHRSRIWQHIFPTLAPVSAQLNFETLGQLRVSGGNIRNIAMNAAFIASELNESICMDHILQAVHEEYAKLEKRLTEDELRGWQSIKL